MAHNNLGNALREQGELHAAVGSFREALRLEPEFPEACNNLGNALRQQGQLDEAVVYLRQAVRLMPNTAEVAYNLGIVLWELERIEESIACNQQAIRVKPDYAAAYVNLGNGLRERGQLDEAIAAYRTAMRLEPNAAHYHSNLVRILPYHPDYNSRAVQEEARQWNARHAEPHRIEIRPHTNLPDPQRRLRIGYVSPDFRDHVDSFFMVPLLSNHDHTQFEIFCYSQVIRPDALTERIRGYADVWRNIVGLSDAQTAELVRSDQIDILVDLKMHTGNNRLLVFARKPAPVQVAWLGYPGTTGLSTIDYRLTDPYLDPPGLFDEFYAEVSLRLPDTFWCYDPLTDQPSVNGLPALESGAITFGCLNSLSKINEECLALWARVLQAVPRSRLLLLVPPGPARLGPGQALPGGDYRGSRRVCRQATAVGVFEALPSDGSGAGSSAIQRTHDQPGRVLDGGAHPHATGRDRGRTRGLEPVVQSGFERACGRDTRAVRGTRRRMGRRSAPAPETATHVADTNVEFATHGCRSLRSPCGASLSTDVAQLVPGSAIGSSLASDSHRLDVLADPSTTPPIATIASYAEMRISSSRSRGVFGNGLDGTRTINHFTWWVGAVFLGHGLNPGIQMTWDQFVSLHRPGLFSLARSCEESPEWDQPAHERDEEDRTEADQRPLQRGTHPLVIRKGRIAGVPADPADQDRRTTADVTRLVRHDLEEIPIEHNAFRDVGTDRKTFGNVLEDTLVHHPTGVRCHDRDFVQPSGLAELRIVSDHAKRRAGKMDRDASIVFRLLPEVSEHDVAAALAGKLAR